MSAMATHRTNDVEPSPPDGLRGPTGGLGILWISVLGLFLELLIIRWIGTEIRIFAYLQNTVLVVCFLGLGFGFLSSSRPIRPGRAFVALTALAVALAVPPTRRVLAGVSEMLNALGDVNIWFGELPVDGASAAAGILLGLALTLAVMVAIVEMFVPIGRYLGRLLDAHPKPIQAYSINVVGSLLGTWLFVALGALEQPPIVWFAVFALLALPWRRSPLLAVVLVAVVVGDWLDPYQRTVWSPYQKLSIERGHDHDPAAGQPILIRVNNVGYQQLIDLRPETLRRIPETPPDEIGRTQYDLPFLLHPSPGAVLIVGAGAGNDAAGALRNGASHVTAVEIDPTIVDLAELHPERPYDSDRVTVVTDDARSYFARTDETFDVIVFALLDSHTTTSMTNARLDHYVYTRESLERARDLLRPGGVMVLKFDPVRMFVIDRMGRLLSETFGVAPLAIPVPTNAFGWGNVMFVAGDLARVGAELAADPVTAGLLAGWADRWPLDLPGTTRVTTDDWPFLYLESPTIPTLFALLGVLLLILVAYARSELDVPAEAGLRHWDRELWHFFALGVGFLLLEVQGISKASVALGNTWVVNAVIITGVLVMVLVANLVVVKWPRVPMRVVYAGLIATPVALYFVDLARFAFMPYATKAVVVGALSTLPMLFSGIVFATAFAETGHRDRALGANLLGALVGALLQSASFVIGIKGLLLIVTAAYAAAVATAGRRDQLSERNASAGSMRAARRAGSYAASPATATRPGGTATNVPASSGETP